MFASFGLRWWQYTNVRGSHEQGTAAEVTGCIEAIPISGFSYVHQMLLFASNCAEGDFPSQLLLLW
jgi:hypothetical protein